MKISSPKLSTNTNIGLLRIHVRTHLINHYARINTYIKKTPSQILIRTNKEYPDAYIHERYRRKRGNPKSITYSLFMNSLFSHTKRTENPYRWNESYFLLGCCFRFFNWGSNYCLVVKQFNREENKINKNKLTQITDTQKSNRMEVGRQSKKQ